MNRYAARQRADLKWQWSCEKDGLTFPVSPCLGHDNGHSTKEEAERHYYDRELGRLAEASSGEDLMFQCSFPGCRTFTQKGLASHGFFFVTTWLCDAHRNKESFSSVHPFSPGMEFWGSY